MAIQIEIGQRWRVNPNRTAYLVVAIEGEYVLMTRHSSPTKRIKMTSLRSSYMLVGSEKEKISIAAWRRHNWKMASDIEVQP